MPRRPKRARQLAGNAYKAREYVCKPQVMDIEPVMETTAQDHTGMDPNASRAGMDPNASRACSISDEDLFLTQKKS
jgi:hypothetical protein